MIAGVTFLGSSSPARPDNEGDQIVLAARRMFGPQALQLLQLLNSASWITDAENARFDVHPEEESFDFDGAVEDAFDAAFPEADSDEEATSEESLHRMQALDLAVDSVLAVAESGSYGRDDDWEPRAGTAAYRAAYGLALRDLIPGDLYGRLTAEWRTVVGPIHPADGDTIA
jgi:hypothetical protein